MVAQLYLVSRDGQPMQRLVGFRRVELAPGAEQTVEMTIDPRLLATWNGDGWTIAKGDYRFAIGDDAETLSAPVTVAMNARSWRDWVYPVVLICPYFPRGPTVNPGFSP